PFLWGTARFRLCLKPIIFDKVVLPFQRTFISSYPVVTQDTQPTHNIVLAKWRVKGEIESFSFFCRNSLLYFLFS
ncbi:MAG: hypothetical protein RBR78_11170, partial [Flavobacteriaceae bacterium]|nr:hypothetical protein [Flavobacteriaceae bacterium]